MRLPQWRTAYASVVGTSHTARGTPCQDAGSAMVITLPNDTEVLLAAVADGAGTASQAERGATFVVKSFLTALTTAISNDPSLAFLDDAFAHKWLVQTRLEIAALAAANGYSVRDYACTFLGAVVGAHVAGYLQIGDGAIVVADAEDEDYSWIFWPQHGEFANSTFFVTQDKAEEILQFERKNYTGEHVHVREIALFSDGMERLILNLAGRSVHGPALRPIFGWLAGTEPVRDNKPSDVLARYLASDQVNRRTDDDKSLVMATRVTPSGPAAPA